MAEPSDIFNAAIDAIIGADQHIGGMAFTRLTAQLDATETATMTVETTVDFGEQADGVGDYLLLVGGEIIYATGSTTTTFTTLSRAFAGGNALTHPPGTLVFDYSRNRSALDHVRRGLLVDYAVGEDLDVIGRNLGLEKCVGLTDTQWRGIIKAVAYGAKSTVQAFTEALDVLWGPGNYGVFESPAEPWMVRVEVAVPPSIDLRGRFLLNSGEAQLTTGANTVDVSYAVASPALAAYPGYATPTYGLRAPGGAGEITYPAAGAGSAIVGVYDDTPQTRRGYRDGLTNYFLPGGSVLGNTITLGTSPGGIGTPVIVDYTAFSAHYLAYNETTIHDQDFYAYLADPLLATRCLLEQIRAAGVQVEVQIEV